VTSTSTAATRNGVPRLKRSISAPARIGKATRATPPKVCCTPRYSPRSALGTSCDSSPETQGNRNAVPSGISVNDVNSTG
jgi:hypothetical protein